MCEYLYVLLIIHNRELACAGHANCYQCPSMRSIVDDLEFFGERGKTFLHMREFLAVD